MGMLLEPACKTSGGTAVLCIASVADLLLLMTHLQAIPSRPSLNSSVHEGILSYSVAPYRVSMFR